MNPPPYYPGHEGEIVGTFSAELRHKQTPLKRLHFPVVLFPNSFHLLEYLMIFTFMNLRYKDYTIEIRNDSTYSLNSADNLTRYEREYFGGHINDDRVYANAKIGIHVSKAEEVIASAIICELCLGTSLHKNSYLLKKDTLFVCCCDKVYSLQLPELKLNWNKRMDPAACIGIYPFHEDFIVHGELQISRINEEASIKWQFSARDIFVAPSGVPFNIIDDRIFLKDWTGYEYVLNADGKVVRET